MKDIYDLIIVGAGPAGLTAAIYAGRAKVKVLVIEKIGLGSLVISHKVDNYPGFPEGITGMDLYNLKKEQAKKFGVEFLEATLLEIDHLNKPILIKTDIGHFSSQALIIATGWPKNNNEKLIGEAEFTGRGVSYCATCDGAFTKGTRVALFGHGNELAEEALYLTKFAKDIDLYSPNGDLGCDEKLEEELKSHSMISMNFNTELLELKGDDFLTGATIKSDNIEKIVDLDFAFLYLGTKSSSELFSSVADVNEEGYIKTNERMETKVEGIYAAGDVREKVLRQITTATADGTIAGIEATRYIRQVKNKK